MVRLLGAVLVAGGAAWAGLSAAEGLKRRVRALDALVDGLSLLEQELELDSPPLPELMERLISRSAGPARALFQGCRESLDRLSREPFSQSWRRLTETLPGLDGEARRALESPGGHPGPVRLAGAAAPGGRRPGPDRDAPRPGGGGAAAAGEGLPGAGGRRRGVFGHSPAVKAAGTRKRGTEMDVDLIFKIAAVGILVAVLNQVLSRAGREEQAMMTTLAGLVVVLMMVVREIADLFDLVKTLFHL